MLRCRAVPPTSIITSVMTELIVCAAAHASCEPLKVSQIEKLAGE